MEANDTNINSADKPSPNLDFFREFGSNTKSLPQLICPSCPVHLNIMYTYTEEYEEAIDGSKSRQLKCMRCHKTAWICEQCNNNFLFHSLKSLKLHNRRYHKNTTLSSTQMSKSDVDFEIENADTYAEDGYFNNIQNDENWISFSNNLHHLNLEERSFTTAIHENNADKYLVANSQDKGHVDSDKMNKFDDQEVALLLDITKLSSNLKPKDNELLMKIVKGMKDVTENRVILDDDPSRARATIPDNVSDLKRYCLKSTYSILKNIPTPKCVNYGNMVNVSAEEPIKFALLIGSPIALLDPEHIEHDVSRMSKNIIGHGKGVKKGLIKLAAEIRSHTPKDCSIKRRIVCITEFRDDFNPYHGNNINNSITLHTQSIIPLDSTIDSKEHTYPVAIGHKHKDNMIIETYYIETLNEIMNPRNNKLFYSSSEKEFLNIIVFPCGFMGDQPGKRFYLNHAGGNSEYGGRFGVSCNVKDIYYQLLSCEECERLLAIGVDSTNCSKCLNWELLNGTYSEECVEDNLNTATCPFKLTMERQDSKGREVCNDIVHNKLSKTAAFKKLKPYNFTGEVKNMIINNAFNRKEELGECTDHVSEYEYPSFAITQRNNFCYNSFTGSPMHLLGLGLGNALITMIFQLASLLDVKSEVTNSVKITMEGLVKARIDFAPLEILIGDKTTGWIGSDYMRLIKLLPYVFRQMDTLIAAKNHNNVNAETYTSKMCKTYLLLRNLEVPDNIKEKREAVKQHMLSMKNNAIEFNNISIQPLICSFHKLVSNIMTASDSRKSKLRIHYKQYLNALHKIDVLIKKLTNDKSDNHKCITMYNNLNIPCVINDIDERGPITLQWEANHHGEKGIQIPKEKFVSQKGNFGEIMIHKMCIEKVLDHLSQAGSSEVESCNKFRNYMLDSRESLQEMIHSSVPIPFVMTKDGRLFFVFEHSDAIQFKFEELIDVQMGWFYFNIKFLTTITNPLLKIEHATAATKCAVLPSATSSNKTCYTAVTNEWMTLDKSGCFEVCSNLNVSIKYKK